MKLSLGNLCDSFAARFRLNVNPKKRNNSKHMGTGTSSLEITYSCFITSTANEISDDD